MTNYFPCLNEYIFDNYNDKMLIFTINIESISSFNSIYAFLIILTIVHRTFVSKSLFI